MTDLKTTAEALEALGKEIDKALKVFREGIKQIATQATPETKPKAIERNWLDNYILNHRWKKGITTPADLATLGKELSQEIMNRIYSIERSTRKEDTQIGFHQCRKELHHILEQLTGRKYFVHAEPGHEHFININLPTEKAKVECTDCKADITAGGFTCPSLAAGNYCEDCFIKIAEQKLKPKQGADNFNTQNLGKWS